MSTPRPVNDEKIENEKNQAEIILNSNVKDTLGEIGNICMGTSATTLSTLLGKRVNITTPKVSICKGSEYLDEYEKPVVATNVSYTEGLDGKNVFLLKKEDALKITNLLMGNEGEPGEEIEELYLSAISEVMNQMVGSSSTALADILHVGINISPPITKELIKGDKEAEQLFTQEESSIKISFRMEIDELLVSNIMQIMPIEFGQRLVDSLNDNKEDEVPEVQEQNPEPPVKEVKQENKTPEKTEKTVDLKAVKYQSFSNETAAQRTAEKNESKKNIDLIMDVPLQVTVVLGKSKKSIQEILNLNMGSIIVLDRIAGEMVDVLVNGKLFARGEVVVIDDNYGVRITEIVSTKYKLN